MIFSGIVEDSTFKVPFVSHKIQYPLIRNFIYKFNSAYVHEFALDKSVLLVITEHTKMQRVISLEDKLKVPIQKHDNKEGVIM